MVIYIYSFIEVEINTAVQKFGVNQICFLKKIVLLFIKHALNLSNV